MRALTAWQENIPLSPVQFSSEGIQPTAVRVSIQVEKSIWFYAWSKITDWEIRALTKSEPYRWVSLNIQKESMSGSKQTRVEKSIWLLCIK